MENDKLLKLPNNEPGLSEESEVELVKVDAFEQPIVKYKNKFYPGFFRNPSSIRRFQIKSDDTFVIGYGKSGTTWLEEIVWLIQNNLNFEEALNTPHFDRVFFIDFCITADLNEKRQHISKPRVFKSHLSVELLPEDMLKKSKVVFITRNPKDMLVSFFKFTKSLKNINTVASFDEFIEMSINNQLPYGSWWDLVNEYKQIDGIFFTTYEELLEKPYETIKSLVNYLEKKYSDEEIKKLISFTSFDKMKNYQSFSVFDDAFIHNNNEEKFSFFRKGQIGNWVEHFSEENSRKIDEIIKTRLHKDIKYQFYPS